MSMITTLILLFVIALSLSLVFTPMVRSLGIRFGAMDVPTARKVHTEPIPRIGGLAVFLSFVITSLLAITLIPNVSHLYKFSFNESLGYAGACVMLCCGLWDDFRRLHPWVKLFFQIVAATLAFVGGAKISALSVGITGVHFALITSYVVTVFWFLLLINAINLIDGLDGLAAGIVFFTSAAMVVSSAIKGQYLAASYFVILGGAVLGFLKYNFNPATVFLGDGGSYFLGYLIALLAVQGSVKSHVGVLMLIPLLALGVPIFDSILSPVRRFITGRSMFKADREHIHHMFLNLGLSSRKVVLIIYGITMFLCVLGILMITIRGRALFGPMLAVLLVGMIFLVRKLGYLEYLAFDKFYGWFQDVTDITGISQQRRSFLSMQIEVNRTQNMDELWENVVEALKMLHFDEALLCVDDGQIWQWQSEEGPDLLKPENSDSGHADCAYSDGLLKMEIPLKDNGDPDFLGKLVVIKDLNKGEIQPYTIRRLESLRRTLIPNLKRLKKPRTEN